MKPKIKILFFQWKLVLGGTETALYDLLNLMNKDKFDITLFVMEEGGVWDSKFSDLGVNIIGPYTELESKKEFISEKEYAKWKKRIDKSINNFYIGLLDVCTTERFDIVVAYHPTDYRLAIFQKKAKTVFYLHVDPINNHFVHYDIITAPFYYKSFDRIISVSDISKKSFVELSKINNIIVHYNPIDSDSIKKKAQELMDISVLTPYICSVGRFTNEKGFERLIRIHRKLLDAGYYHKLVIVGEGELRDDIENTIDEVNANDTVILTGHLDNPFPIIKNSLMLVVASFHEGLSMTAMESIILGVPVVSTIPTINELSGDEPCGILTDYDDESLYQGILKLISNDDFYKKTKDAAVRRSAFFDGKRMADEVEKEFINLYNSKSDYRQKRKYYKKEVRRVKRTVDKDLKHLPNRVLKRFLGDNNYEKLKSLLK